ncbi:MAG TPA: orotidine-5'-phosphate decarboxylase [Phnomibacter sp.]|nr:orotidine-5'-phosphate decarboxylase [Phnomibacter sp.]
MNRAFLVNEIVSKQTYLCVGLDTDETKLPQHLRGQKDAVLQFNKAIIDATKDYCVSYKINTAFYEAMGSRGWEIMEETFAYIPTTHFTIADAKRGDIGNTSHQYARAFFEHLKVDAITVAPYMGEDSVRPFLEYEDKWTIVLGLTSNKGSDDFQRLALVRKQEGLGLVPNIVSGERSELLYEKVLETVASWGTPDNLMFVAGATQASEFSTIRSIVPDHFLLVPGVGAQGGSLADVSKYGLNAECGLLVNASRAVIFASSGEDFAEAAAAVAKSYQQEMASFFSMP